MTLRDRVKAARQLLKDKKVRRAKVKFFDETFGMMGKQKSIRYDNVWAGLISDEEFTIKLENYAKAQKDYTGHY